MKKNTPDADEQDGVDDEPAQVMRARVSDRALQLRAGALDGNRRRISQRRFRLRAERPQRALLGDRLGQRQTTASRQRARRPRARPRLCRLDQLMPLEVGGVRPPPQPAVLVSGRLAGLVAGFRIELEPVAAGRHQKDDHRIRATWRPSRPGGTPRPAPRGGPRLSHAPMITAAVALIDSEIRRSSTGFTAVKNFS